MQTIKTTLLNATAQLKTHSPEPESAGFEAQLMLTHVLNENRAWLIAHGDDVPSAQDLTAFEALLARRLAGEPMAYIFGEREFYGLPFKVTPDTLIPRQDTETLVETALHKLAMRFRGGSDIRVLDLGTGSGAIALAIAHHQPEALVTAVDFSDKALQVAKANADRLAIENVQFIQSNWFDALGHQSFDVIVSNPPYIEEQDAHLDQGDLRFEPKSALTSGADGLDDIKKILNECLVYLKPQAWMMLEHGYHQAEAVQNLMAETGLVEIETIKDLGGNDRVTIGKNGLVVSAHWG